MAEGAGGADIPVDSFGFRVACYEQFHWTPETVKGLSELEALRLSIYFEETGAYLHKKRKEQEAGSSPSGGYGEDERVELYIGDDEEDE
jgi:hypothetical protein